MFSCNKALIFTYTVYTKPVCSMKLMHVSVETTANFNIIQSLTPPCHDVLDLQEQQRLTPDVPTHKTSNHFLFPGIFGKLSHTGMKSKSRKMGTNYAIPGSSSAISAAKLKVISFIHVINASWLHSVDIIDLDARYNNNNYSPVVLVARDHHDVLCVCTCVYVCLRSIQ